MSTPSAETTCGNQKKETIFLEAYLMFKSKEELKAIRKQYPEGTVIIIDHVDDIHAPSPGTELTVQHVDDIGQLHCAELGIAINPDVDRFHKKGE